MVTLRPHLAMWAAKVPFSMLDTKTLLSKTIKKTEQNKQIHLNEKRQF